MFYYVHFVIYILITFCDVFVNIAEKCSLIYFNHPNIFWYPLALILEIANEIIYKCNASDERALEIKFDNLCLANAAFFSNPQKNYSFKKKHVHL